MALFCSACKPLTLCPNFKRNYAIQRPFSPKMSISKTSNVEISRISIPASAKPDKFIEKTKCHSSVSSPRDLDKGAPCGVIIFIKGLAQSTSEGNLKTAFSQFGEVGRVKIINDKKSKQSLGFAYLWFTREEHAQAAVEEMNGQFFEGRFIRVTLAKPGSCKPRPKPSPYKFSQA